MLIFHDPQRLTPAETEVLRVLLKGPTRWKELLGETGLSRQGLSNAIESLRKKRETGFEQNPDKKKGVSYGRTMTTYQIRTACFERVRDRIGDWQLLHMDRYEHLKGLVEKILKSEKNKYTQYLMLLDVFRGWGNADLKWVHNQVIWATVALADRDFQTFRDLQQVINATYQKCIRYLFEVSRKNPVAALALIDSSEDEWTSDELDEWFEEGCLPSRDEILQGALEPMRQDELPNFEGLKKRAQARTRDFENLKEAGTDYSTRTEKQIRKMLSYFRRIRKDSSNDLA